MGDNQAILVAGWELVDPSRFGNVVYKFLNRFGRCIFGPLHVFNVGVHELEEFEINCVSNSYIYECINFIKYSHIATVKLLDERVYHTIDRSRGDILARRIEIISIEPIVDSYTVCRAIIDHDPLTIGVCDCTFSNSVIANVLEHDPSMILWLPERMITEEMYRRALNQDITYYGTHGREKFIELLGIDAVNQFEGARTSPHDMLLNIIHKKYPDFNNHVNI
jgi:hypothetical protein